MRAILGKYLLLAGMVLLGASCAVQHEAIMADAIRFSDDAVTSYTHKDGKFKNLYNQSSPYLLYDKNGFNKAGKEDLQKFIRGKETGKATAGYYALDLALDRTEYVRKHQFKNDPFTKSYIIYMTDGLDNASVQVAHNHKQLWFITKESSYAKRIQKKMKRVMGVCKLQQNTFQVFPIMFLGEDMQENMKKRGANTLEERKKLAAEDMQYYRGASKGTTVPEVLVETDYKQIGKGFEGVLASSGFEFHVPVGYRDQRIRMKLTNEQGQHIEIEGLLTKMAGEWWLKEITYSDGVTIPDQRYAFRNKPLREVAAVNKDDTKSLMVIFRLDDIRLDGKNFKVQEAVQEHERAGFFETNTEYEMLKRNLSDSYVLMILDVSSSLRERLKDEQQAMEDILKVILKTAEK